MMREFRRGDTTGGWKTEAPGPGRRGECAVLLEEGPYEGQHVPERVVVGRMGGCGICTWGVRWGC